MVRINQDISIASRTQDKACGSVFLPHQRQELCSVSLRHRFCLQKAGGVSLGLFLLKDTWPTPLWLELLPKIVCL